jgi:hypothetical protein
MVVFILIFGLGIYLLIMFGLTFWFKRYHYYQNRFYNSRPTDSALDDLPAQSGPEPDPGSNRREKSRSEVVKPEES